MSNWENRVHGNDGHKFHCIQMFDTLNLGDIKVFVTKLFINTTNREVSKI